MSDEYQQEGWWPCIKGHLFDYWIQYAIGAVLATGIAAQQVELNSVVSDCEQREQAVCEHRDLVDLLNECLDSHHNTVPFHGGK